MLASLLDENFSINDRLFLLLQAISFLIFLHHFNRKPFEDVAELLSLRAWLIKLDDRSEDRVILLYYDWHLKLLCKQFNKDPFKDMGRS